MARDGGHKGRRYGIVRPRGNRAGNDQGAMRTLLMRVAFVSVLFLSSAACDAAATGSLTTDQPSNATPRAAAGQAPQWGVQTKTSGCAARGGLPDPACTPGDIFPEATKDKICVSGYSATVRDVPTSEKNAVYAEYGITHHATGEYEVDHFVSLELGGSNDISNLWPEPAAPTPGFHQKDKVENYLHDQVCSGSLTLAEAQRQIATNWLAVYDRMPNK
jgi:hypothetical protein